MQNERLVQRFAVSLSQAHAKRSVSRTTAAGSGSYLAPSSRVRSARRVRKMILMKTSPDKLLVPSAPAKRCCLRHNGGDR